eukprot:SAG22_NODE_7249_length_758_cov_0.735964_1_plen_141_part_10
MLLWVSCAVRARDNHALEHAISQANLRGGQPVWAVFALDTNFPGATERSFAFLLEGLADAWGQFARRGVQLLVLRGPPPAVIQSLARPASLVVCDVGYTRTSRRWRQSLASGEHRCGCPIHAGETEVVVPLGLVSSREEPA